MAVITVPPMIKEIHGKVGDIVFVKRNGTRFIRKHVVPFDPKTGSQVKNRCAFANCVAMWRHLPQSFRDSWNRYGRTANRTGYNLFISENMRALRRGKGPVPVKAGYLKEQIHRSTKNPCVRRKQSRQIHLIKGAGHYSGNDRNLLRVKIE